MVEGVIWAKWELGTVENCVNKKKGDDLFR